MDSFDPSGVLSSDEYALEPAEPRRPIRSRAPGFTYEHMFSYNKISCGEGGPFVNPFAEGGREKDGAKGKNRAFRGAEQTFIRREAGSATFPGKGGGTEHG